MLILNSKDFENPKIRNTQKFWTSGRKAKNTRVLKGVVCSESRGFMGFSNKKSAP